MKNEIKEEIEKGEMYLADLRNEITMMKEKIERNEKENDKLKKEIENVKTKLSYAYCSMANLRTTKNN